MRADALGTSLKGEGATLESDYPKKLFTSLDQESFDAFKHILEDVRAGTYTSDRYGFLSPETEIDITSAMRSLSKQSLERVREAYKEEAKTRKDAARKAKGPWYRRIFGGKN